MAEPQFTRTGDARHIPVVRADERCFEKRFERYWLLLAHRGFSVAPSHLMRHRYYCSQVESEWMKGKIELNRPVLTLGGLEELFKHL